MKQKFTLNIADIQLSVVTDASTEDVERIRGLLDRKMREIYLKSRCPKTEAALLCAMDFAADRATLQEQVATLDEQCGKYALILDGLKEKTADQAAELERLRSENAVLRSLLTQDVAPAVAPDPISPAAFFAEVASAQTAAPKPAPEAPACEETPAADNLSAADDLSAANDPQQMEIFDLPELTEPAPAEEPSQSRSRVGSMFDHLSFGDVD